jgi:hypothetical protein
MVTVGVALGLWPGCTQPTSEPVDTYLVRVGGRTLSVAEFNEVFEISGFSTIFSVFPTEEDALQG